LDDVQNVPERGAIECEAPEENVAQAAGGRRVQLDFDGYRHILGTNFREFQLEGIDGRGERICLERHVLADSTAENVATLRQGRVRQAGRPTGCGAGVTGTEAIRELRGGEGGGNSMVAVSAVLAP